MILLCSATEFEIKPTLDWLASHDIADIQTFITGVGAPSTMYMVMKAIMQDKPQLIIQAGIAGSFKKDINKGSVVIVESEQWCDLGIEDNEQFLDLFDMGFAKPNELPYSNSLISCQFHQTGIEHLQKVKAVTANTAHGNEQTINKIISKYNPDIESMEGAAIAHICAMENIPFIQIRSISNFVEARNRNNWDIPLAIKNLNIELRELLLKNNFYR